jgi:hypothetical protein
MGFIADNFNRALLHDKTALTANMKVQAIQELRSELRGRTRLLIRAENIYVTVGRTTRHASREASGFHSVKVERRRRNRKSSPPLVAVSEIGDLQRVGVVATLKRRRNVV